MVQSTFVGIAALLVTLITASDDVQPIAEQRDAETTAATSFFPLGVYWPWETTGVVGQGSERVAKLEPFLIQRLDQLAAHHVNIVWTVNGPDSVAELELLCRLAEPRKIRIIAGSGWWAMHPGNANDQWAQVAVAHLQKVCQELAGKPRPMAYTIADEPSGGHLAAFGRYAAAVKAAGIPATTTVMHGDIEAAADKAATLPWLSVDFYPFFGSTHGPRGDSSYAWFDRIVRRIVKATQQHEQTPWVMAQAYQEIWGPSRLEPDGQVTVLPGGGQHWLLPTPAQIRWQAWTAAALGAKGIFFFAYGVPFQPNPKADPIKEPWAVQKETPTGGPTSLVSYPDFHPGPQLQAMGEVYAEIQPLAAQLLHLRPADEEQQLIWSAESPAFAGDIVNLLVDTTSKDLYAAVVASPKREAASLPLRLSPNVVRLIPQGAAPQLGPLTAGPAPFQTAQIKLAPGQGALYRLEIQQRFSRRVVFHEDFAAEDWAARAAQMQNLKAQGEPGKPRNVQATRGEPNIWDKPFPPSDCFVLYDLQRLLPALPKADAYRLLEYRGWGGPIAGQGIYIWAGADPTELQPLVSCAALQPAVQLLPEHRYLKIAVSFRQAEPHYAGLTSWAVVDWLAKNP